jgi:UDP-glucose 4-epimerase
LDYTVLRIANPYGERQNPGGGQGAVTTFLWKVLNGEPITVWGDGSVARDYFHISDLVRAFVRVIEMPTPSKIYNIGSGKPHSLNEIIDVIAAVAGTAPTVNYVAARKLDVPVNCLDVSLAAKELGWSANLGLEEGIHRTWADIKSSTRK